jgi:hypothetical protein
LSGCTIGGFSRKIQLNGDADADDDDEAKTTSFVSILNFRVL